MASGNEASVMEQDEEAVKEEQDYPDFDGSLFEFLNEFTENVQKEITADFKYVRPMRAIIEFLNNPHGSVKLFQGDTCVIGSAYGPGDVRMSKELPHRAAVDVLYRPKITGTSKALQELGLDSIVKERTIESIITSIFEATLFLEDYPSAGFNIILQECENDGCLLSSCINAAFIALLDGSCSLRDQIAAVTILIRDDDTVVVDPSLSQTKQGENNVMVTYVLSNDDDVLMIHQSGRTSEKVLLQCLNVAKLAVSEIFNFYHVLMKKKYSQYIQFH